MADIAGGGAGFGRAIAETFAPACATVLVSALLLSLLPSAAAMGAKPDPIPAGTVLSAEASDPVAMGWMQGIPPPEARRLSAVDGTFFRFPALRWSVVHMREFLPTVNVSRGLGAPVPLRYALDPQVDAVTFTPWGSSQPLTWRESLGRNYTDGILVLHHGKVVYERYFGELQPDRMHAAMSVTKSFTGTLAAILVAEGILDPGARVTRYLPELKASAFGDASVREVMNMTTCLQYSEDYANPKAQVWDYAKASNPLINPADHKGPTGTFAYLETLKPEPGCVPGKVFGYKTPNADVLGWIVARAAGKSIATLLSDRIWSRLGMEQSAYLQVDAAGMPIAGGGLSAGLRDMARFGQMMLDGGMWQGRQIVPKTAIASIRQGGSIAAFARSGHPELKGWSYQDMWWITHNADGAFAARGVHGQTIYIDPMADMVIVRFASHPSAANAANDPTSLPAYQALADYLMAHEARPRPAGATRETREIAVRGTLEGTAREP